ncbi:hypothetical protein A5644_03870 [Mycobacterium intracellulare subsp. yongonense]|uniref:transposase n=1 Tax=Mycobacterium intracellulare TaxID=1767 RepID=UPI00080B5C04|nr:transposase [Mycobacterium intracellulare]OCB11117.1 hypothetical protein A5644_03870 [Mycobacterium intracellulare subsp. yongonense]
MKTTAGPVTLQRLKVRGTTERFASQLFGKGVTKTNALESLVIVGFVRGLSVRDVEATLVEGLGKAAMSKSTVSRVCEDIKTQLEAWSARLPDEVQLDYLVVDGSHFKYHASASAEPVQAAWGIDTDGKPVFVGLEVATSESGDAWEGLPHRARRAWVGVSAAGDQRRRGRVDRRGRAHHGRGAAAGVSGASRYNVLAKVPKNAQAEVKADYWAIFDGARLDRAWPRRGRLRAEADRPVRKALARLVSGGGAVPAR